MIFLKFAKVVTGSRYGQKPAKSITNRARLLLCMWGGAVNRQPGYRARNLQRRGKFKMTKKRPKKEREAEIQKKAKNESKKK